MEMISGPVVFPGVHNLGLARHLERCMVSANQLEQRRSDFAVGDWMMDSGAFTRLVRGLGHLPVHVYAEMVERWAGCGRLLAAVAQDFMCEPFVLDALGGTVARHQALTTERYLELRDMVGEVHVMPVVQGFSPDEYASHAADLAEHVPEGSWVGVGSVCKRQGAPAGLLAVLAAVHEVAPTWRLHGFGVKSTALAHYKVRSHLWSVDSMAWSFAARWRKLKTGVGPGANDIKACLEWLAQVEALDPDPDPQMELF